MPLKTLIRILRGEEPAPETDELPVEEVERVVAHHDVRLRQLEDRVRLLEIIRKEEAEAERLRQQDARKRSYGGH
jgi:hypothetical protein